MNRKTYRQGVVRPPSWTADCPARLIAVAAAIALLCSASSALAKGTPDFGPTTGHVTFDDTGNLTLDLGFGGAIYTSAWMTDTFANADGPCHCGQGFVILSGASHTLVRVSKQTSLRDIADQINQSRELRAAVLASGKGYRLAVVNVSGSRQFQPHSSGNNAFDDTGNLTVPSGVRRVIQRGVRLGGEWGPATVMARVVSAPVKSASAPGTSGSGTLRLGYNQHRVYVRISRGMNLYHVAASINRMRSVFHASVQHTRYGAVLQVDAVAPETRDLYAADDAGSLVIPGVNISFDDTGNLTLSGGWTNFDDTGNLTVSGGSVAFDDTGNLTVPRGSFSFDDTGNLTIPSGFVDFDDTGNLTIVLPGLFG